jgi:hypothetical protein
LADNGSPNLVTITISDADTKELVGEYVPNENTGQYTYILPPERLYNILFTAPGYLSYTHDFRVVIDSSYQYIHRAVELADITFYNPSMKQVTGMQEAVVGDLLFESNEYTLKKYAENLKTLAAHLVANPECIIEIGGHTDNVGSEDYNKRLSRLRVKEVARELERLGVSRNSYVIKDYGNSMPIARNDVPQGLAFNRRVEFKVLRQGVRNLRVALIVVPRSLSVE